MHELCICYALALHLHTFYISKNRPEKSGFSSENFDQIASALTASYPSAGGIFSAAGTSVSSFSSVISDAETSGFGTGFSST